MGLLRGLGETDLWKKPEVEISKFDFLTFIIFFPIHNSVQSLLE
jgi:hypothetical protein